MSKPSSERMEIPPAPAPQTEPTPRSPPRETEDTESERLEAICLATPWTAAESTYGPKLLSPATQERLDVLERECRDVHPELPPGRFAAASPMPPGECHYGIARIYFEERRYPEAARWFRRVATENAGSDIAVFAAQLYLESLNVLSAHSSPARPECERLMIEGAARFACEYCERADTRDQCEIFRRVGPETANCRK